MRLARGEEWNLSEAALQKSGSQTRNPEFDTRNPDPGVGREASGQRRGVEAEPDTACGPGARPRRNQQVIARATVERTWHI